MAIRIVSKTVDPTMHEPGLGIVTDDGRKLYLSGDEARDLARRLREMFPQCEPPRHKGASRLMRVPMKPVMPVDLYGSSSFVEVMALILILLGFAALPFLPLFLLSMGE